MLLNPELNITTINFMFFELFFKEKNWEFWDSYGLKLVYFQTWHIQPWSATTTKKIFLFSFGFQN